MKKTLNILFFLLIISGVKAQKDSLLSELFIKPEIGYGFIFEHRDALSYLAKGHITSFKLTVGKSTYGKRTWQQKFRFPDLGFGYYYTDLQNPEVLGNVHALYFFTDIPYIRKEKFSFDYNLEIGLSRLSKTYEVETNYINSAISSHINAYINMGLITKFRLSNKLILRNAINFTHYSNAKVSIPNLGINVLNLSTALQFYVKPQIQKHKIIKNERTIKNIISTSYAGGIQANYAGEKQKYYCSSLSLDYQRVQKSNKISLGGGLDFFYNDAISSRLNTREDSVNYGSIYDYRGGVHFSYNLLFNKVTYTIQIGVYTFAKWRDVELVYNRFGFVYNFTKRFTTHVTLKTHLVKADYLEMGVGYILFKGN